MTDIIGMDAATSLALMDESARPQAEPGNRRLPLGREYYSGFETCKQAIIYSLEQMSKGNDFDMDTDTLSRLSVLISNLQPE